MKAGPTLTNAINEEAQEKSVWGAKSQSNKRMSEGCSIQPSASGTITFYKACPLSLDRKARKREACEACESCELLIEEAEPVSQ